ncbi:MAG: serine/threonine-protein kinase [Polyangiales bacterium]
MSSIEPDLHGFVGRHLDGGYVVEAAVGEGGHGVVYRARRGDTAERVAIKVLKIPADSTEEKRRGFVARFREEARLLARLDHPAVVRALDSGVATTPTGEVLPWTAFEWVEGRSLTRWLSERDNAPLRPRAALSLLRPVFEALSLAHSMGIVHRDIKPDNIMVIERAGGFTTRVLDFGIAKTMQPGEAAVTTGETRTNSPVRCFSQEYAAPEQLSGLRTGPWTDVHGLALVLTETIVGRRAYEGENTMALMAAALSPLRPTPRALEVDIGAWEHIVAKALSLQANERYTNAGEMLAALDAATPSLVPPPPQARDGAIETPAPPPQADVTRDEARGEARDDDRRRRAAIVVLALSVACAVAAAVLALR